VAFWRGVKVDEWLSDRGEAKAGLMHGRERRAFLRCCRGLFERGTPYRLRICERGTLAGAGALIRRRRDPDSVALRASLRGKSGPEDGGYGIARRAGAGRCALPQPAGLFFRHHRAPRESLSLAARSARRGLGL